MNGNTPTMMQSEKERAPWNEKKIPDANFRVDVDCVLFKRDVQVCTSDYIPKIDEEGYSCANTENTDWKRAYTKDHYTVPQLLEILKGYAFKDLTDDKVVKTKTQKDRLKRIIDDCDGWVLDSESYNEA